MTRSLHRSIRNIWQSDHRATDWSVVDEMSCSFDWMCILCPSHQRTMTMKHSKFHNKVQLFSRLRYHIVNLKSRNTMSCERDEHSTDCPTIRAEEQYFLSAIHFLDQLGKNASSSCFWEQSKINKKYFGTYAWSKLVRLITAVYTVLFPEIDSRLLCSFRMEVQRGIFQEEEFAIRSWSFPLKMSDRVVSTLEHPESLPRNQSSWKMKTIPSRF